MRDHRKLRAFQLADNLTIAVYKATAAFPAAERFGLSIQMRRSAVSVASNIVEGCARRSEADYLRFLDMAYGSAKELQYQASLAGRLGYVQHDAAEALVADSEETSRVVRGLIEGLERNSRQRGNKQ